MRSYMKFKVGDKVRFKPILMQTEWFKMLPFDNKHDVLTISKIENNNIFFESITYVCFESNDFILVEDKEDAGKHYRFMYKGIKLDPFRIASIYNMKSFAMMTILKKVLCAGNRGHKNYQQDLKDIICAAERELELIQEDETTSDTEKQ